MAEQILVGIDTGASNGVVTVREGVDKVEHATFRDVFQVVLAALSAKPTLVVIEDAGDQFEYKFVRYFLDMFGVPYTAIRPGQWKPCPQCKVSAKDTPGWTPHERDALALVRYAQLYR